MRESSDSNLAMGVSQSAMHIKIPKVPNLCLFNKDRNITKYVSKRIFEAYKYLTNKKKTEINWS